LKRVLFLSIGIAGICGTAAGADFGIVFSPVGEYRSDAKGRGFGFTGNLSPWFSAALGGKINLYLSGKAVFEYQYDEWIQPTLFELERTELNFRPIEALYLTMGRQNYRDSGGMIASGLFDGVSAGIGLGGLRLSLGALYTGFLYKETAEILMTAEDRDRYLSPLDYNDPETYFASRRILIPLDLEFSDLSSRLSLALTLLTQIDINDAPALHTQYLEARLGLGAADALRFTLTGIGGLAKSDDPEVRAHFAAALGADWTLPGTLTDMLSAELRWGSGTINDAIGPFIPVSGIAQGEIFIPPLPGLMNLRIAYTARSHRDLSFSGKAIVFWRTDVGTFQDGDLDGLSRERYLGTEVSGSLIWAPQSMVRINAGGGVFFPGGAFAEDTEIRWKLQAGIIFSL
jgi:hypothetical protein